MFYESEKLQIQSVFARLVTNWKKRILATAIEIQKENWERGIIKLEFGEKAICARPTLNHSDLIGDLPITPTSSARILGVIFFINASIFKNIHGSTASRCIIKLRTSPKF